MKLNLDCIRDILLDIEDTTSINKSWKYDSKLPVVAVRSLRNKGMANFGALQLRLLRELEEGTIQLAQLHGQEDEAYIRRLRERTDKPLIQAFSIRTEADARRTLSSTADYLLFDQGSGGTGRSFDWSLLPEISRPFFLAGGLGEDNLAEAIRQVRPWAVDLSSSLETGGLKDPEKIRRAVELVRGSGEETKRRRKCQKEDLEYTEASTFRRR